MLLAAALTVLLTAMLAAESRQPVDLTETLRRAGERVQQYFARAQSLVCIETVRLRPFEPSSGSDARGRTIESELRLAWEPAIDAARPPDAAMLRQVLKVNGHVPRQNDPHNCTTPEQNSTETPPLAMLLPQQQRDYVFSLAGLARVEKRRAIMVDYRITTTPSITVALVEGKEDCLTWSLEGGTRGRIWIDAETFDVLRLDQGLTGLIDIPLPRSIARRNDNRTSWTMERLDVSIRFKPVTFQNPDETLMLPVTVSSMRVTRGSGMPRLWTLTDYSHYQRFLTGARIVKD